MVHHPLSGWPESGMGSSLFIKSWGLLLIVSCFTPHHSGATARQSFRVDLVETVCTGRKRDSYGHSVCFSQKLPCTMNLGLWCRGCLRQFRGAQILRIENTLLFPSGPVWIHSPTHDPTLFSISAGSAGHTSPMMNQRMTRVNRAVIYEPRPGECTNSGARLIHDSCSSPFGPLSVGGQIPLDSSLEPTYKRKLLGDTPSNIPHYPPYHSLPGLHYWASALWRACLDWTCRLDMGVTIVLCTRGFIHSLASDMAHGPLLEAYMPHYHRLSVERSTWECPWEPRRPASRARFRSPPPRHTMSQVAS